MLGPLRIIKICLYTITHIIGLRYNLHVHHQHKYNTSDNTTLQQKSVKILCLTLVN